MDARLALGEASRSGLLLAMSQDSAEGVIQKACASASKDAVSRDSLGRLGELGVTQY